MDELERVIDVMDRLYSPGGCPWDRQQTHESLVRYLLEESHELAEAIETGDRENLREELGDVLFQVLFHARIASEDPDGPFTIEDVARDLADKLVRRHPHVFAVGPGADAVTADEVLAGWEDLKKAEKSRESVLDGIPLAQGALSRAQKIVSRATKAGVLPDDEAATPSGTPEESYGAELLDLVRRAQADGVDAEGAMRAASRRLEGRVRDAETGEARGAGQH